MTIEFTPISQIVEENKEQTAFKEKIHSWIDGKIDFNELMLHFPSYELSIPERITQSVKRIIKKRTP